MVKMPEKDADARQAWRWHCLRLAVKSGIVGVDAVPVAEAYRKFVEQGEVPGNPPAEETK